ncbi:TPA: DNA-binding protein [Salmonella enterica subsp. enterica serovar Newport]|uniref:DNA-binding protein n=1 Tax=Salmonella sp. SAL04162 TaxID=3159782 RepID=UPI002A2270A9|nr:DNA-binding protein [Salmonella enterica]
MAVSKADVVNACNELYAQGKNVTLDAVRTVTGGSFSTISPMVKEWKAEQSGVNASLESSVARTDVPEKLTELLNTLWAAAMAAASQKMDAERQLLNDYKTELENERSDVMFAADRVSAELDDLKFDFSCLNAKHAELKEKADNFERENISLRAEIEAQNKIIANNESVLGELTRFLKSLNDTVPAAVPASAADNNENKDVPASAGSSVNSETANKNESKSESSETKATSQSVSKAKNKAATKKNAAAGNAPGSSLPVRGKTVTGNIIAPSSGAVA